MTRGIIAALILISSTAAASEAEVTAFLTDHLKLLEQQDAEAAIRNLHSQGKTRAKSVHDLKTKLKSMKFKYKLIESTYIGKDKEFFYIRYKQHTMFDERFQKLA